MWQKPIKVDYAYALAQELGDADTINLNDETTKQVFKDLSKIEGLLDFLRDTMANDVTRYFGAQDDHERSIIRGAYARTAYLRSNIMKLLTEG